jgi:hypothetical protein
MLSWVDGALPRLLSKREHRALVLHSGEIDDRLERAAHSLIRRHRGGSGE